VTDSTVLLTNNAFGYPRGQRRRVDPIALLCAHITANPRTPPATAIQERNYADRAGSNGPSAHGYMDRDGSVVWAIDTRYAAWSNGVLRSPKAVAKPIVDFVGQGYNANEAYHLEVEMCGRDPDYTVTVEQTDRLAHLIAEAAIETGLPIDRSTVHLHSDLDTVNRPNCPIPAKAAEAWVAGVIKAAKGYALELQYADALGTIAALQREVGALNVEVSSLELALADLSGQRTAYRDWGRELKSLAGQALALDEPEF
jgi:N-acetylmuramoyl-L-alanine amidase CwlA